MRILITGSAGQVGAELVRARWPDSIDVIGLTHDQLDITNKENVDQTLEQHHPDIVINTAAYTATDKAEEDVDLAYAINQDGPENLASSCQSVGATLIHFSTDYVFDGAKKGAYLETDPVAPLCVYGASKNAGEESIRRVLKEHIILRTSWVYSSHGSNFVKTMLGLGAKQDKIKVVANQVGCPTAALEIAGGVVQIVRKLFSGAHENYYGTFHMSASGTATWYSLAHEIFNIAAPYMGCTPALEPVDSEVYPGKAKRPENSVLDGSKLKVTFNIELPDWHQSLVPVVRELVTKTGETGRR